jgi:hypothetical protein
MCNVGFEEGNLYRQEYSHCYGSDGVARGNYSPHFCLKRRGLSLARYKQ